jgi:undecaprenyl-diphosphatase
MAILPEALRGADHALFHKINAVWTCRLFDAVMPVLTDLQKVPWFKFLVLPAGLGWWLYAKRREGAKVLLGLCLVIGATDMTAHRLVKPLFHRSRPQKAGVEVVLRTAPLYGYSFPSNHASNTFAGAAFLGSLYPPARIALLALAALIAYSRVYVGVHFPLDVLAGALWGLAVGLLGALAWRRAGLAPPSRQKP